MTLIRTAVTLIAIVLGGCTSTPPTESPTPPVSTPTRTASPSPSPAPSLQPSPTPSPSPSSAPTPTPRPTDPPAWPLERIGSGDVSVGSLAVDAAGNAHVVLGSERGLTYMTNQSGGWKSEPIGTQAEGDFRDRAPVIAVDESGAVVVAYGRSSCRAVLCLGAEIRVLRLLEGGWSEPEIVGAGMSPSMAVKGGHVHLAYLATAFIDDIGCHPPVLIGYASDVGGQWIAETVADDGYWPQIDVGSDGSTSILFSNWCPPFNRAGLQVVSRAAMTDGFTFEPIPETEAGTEYSWATALDDVGGLHVLYGHDDPNTGEMESLYVQRDGPDWTSPVQPIEGQEPMSMAVAPDGTAHVLAVGREGTWYATNATGSFASELVSPMAQHVSDGAAIAIDEGGRVHLMFEARDGDENPELWYAVR